MRTLDLSPLFRSTIGFDRFSDLIDTALRGQDNSPSYPPYNIEKLSEDEYRIVLAVAGFKDEDVTITVQQNQLNIVGRHQDKTTGKEANYLHKGIATRSFERNFNLADHVKVTAATMSDGLLSVELRRELPEAVKPRTIAVNGKKPTVIDAPKAA